MEDAGHGDREQGVQAMSCVCPQCGRPCDCGEFVCALCDAGIICMKETKVYIAGPYSSAPLKNTERAIDTADILTRRGFVPFCPHLNHYWDERWKHPAEFWYKYDMHWLRACDCLLRLPGESKGADNEVEEMKRLGRPVFYDIKDLVKHYGKEN